MEKERNEGGSGKGSWLPWLQVVIIVVTVVLAVFMGSINTNQSLNQLQMSMNQRLDRLHARIDLLNREMGEVKTELRLRFDNLEKELATFMGK